MNRVVGGGGGDGMFGGFDGETVGDIVLLCFG